MRKHILLLVCLIGLTVTAAPQLLAQDAAGKPAAQSESDSDSMKWKLINTGIFALLVGYAVIMYGPKFFQARSLDIQKAIKESTGLKIEADFRYSEIDKKMSNLSGEVARMKGEAAAQIEREHQRIRQDTAQEIEHLNRNIENEIDSLRAEGARQVKRHTAELALGLAERRLQSHFTQNDSQNDFREFINLVGSGGNN